MEIGCLNVHFTANLIRVFEAAFFFRLIIFVRVLWVFRIFQISHETETMEMFSVRLEYGSHDSPQRRFPFTSSTSWNRRISASPHSAAAINAIRRSTNRSRKWNMFDSTPNRIRSLRSRRSVFVRCGDAGSVRGFLLNGDKSNKIIFLLGKSN